MKKEEIIAFITHERDLYVKEKEVRIAEKLEAMKKGDLKEAIKFDRWESDCETLLMELNYIVRKINENN